MTREQKQYQWNEQVIGLYQSPNFPKCPRATCPAVLSQHSKSELPFTFTFSFLLAANSSRAGFFRRHVTGIATVSFLQGNRCTGGPQSDHEGRRWLEEPWMSRCTSPCPRLAFRFPAKVLDRRLTSDISNFTGFRPVTVVVDSG